MKKEYNREYKTIAEFSYIDDVLAIDKTIRWLENRLSMKKKPKNVPKNLIKFLEEQRKSASSAVNSKSWSWD